MQCHEFDERLQLLLDDRQAPERDGKLQAHAQACGSCREILQVQESLFRDLDRARAPAPSQGFASRVLQRADVASVVRQRAPSRRWLVAGAALSTAAAALLALTLAINGGRRQPGDPAVAAPEPRAIDSAVQAGDPSLPSDPAPGLNSPEGDRPVTAAPAPTLAKHDVQSIEQYGQALQSLASQVPQAVERLDEVEQNTPGLRPVRTSFTLAIGTIRRTIPPRPTRPARAPTRPAKRDSGLLWSSAAFFV